MLQLWRITGRHLGMAKSQQWSFFFVIAVLSHNEKDAVKMARLQYSDGWWEEAIITSVERIGELKSAEGLVVPQEDLD